MVDCLFVCFASLWGCVVSDGCFEDAYVPQIRVGSVAEPSGRLFGVAYWVDGEFLRGPIPLSWLSSACSLGVTALRMALAAWFARGLATNKGQREHLKLSAKKCDRFCVNRGTKSDGLNELENAGLVTALRRGRAAPVVTIITDGSYWVEKGEFLRGPIPLSWLSPACRLSKSSLKVALAIWFVSGL